MERRWLRPGSVVVPLLLVLLLSSAAPHVVDGQLSAASGGSAANVTRLALEGRLEDVRAWFEAHPESCVNQRRLISVAEGGGLAGGLSQAATERFWSLARPDSGSDKLQVADEEMERYQLLRKVKAGREGEVVLGFDKNAGKMVAIKKVPSVFKNGRSGMRQSYQVWREIKMLRLMSGSGDIMDMERVLMPRDTSKFQNVYQVYGLLESGMPKYNAGHILTAFEAERLRRNIFQLIRGLHFMHSAHVVHNDLRYANVMVDANCDLKIIDLGISRVERRLPQPLPLPHTIGDGSTRARDMWMAGSAILYAIGRSGLGIRLHLHDATRAKLAEVIINLLGPPSDRVIRMYSPGTQDAWRKAIKAHGRSFKSLSDWFPNADSRLLDLVKRMMPLDRDPPTAKELLQHKYFEGMDLSSVKRGPSGASELKQNLPTEDQRMRAKIMRAVRSVNTQYRKSEIGLK